MKIKDLPASCVGTVMLVKVPPLIVRPEELVKNDMRW